LSNPTFSSERAHHAGVWLAMLSGGEAGHRMGKRQAGLGHPYPSLRLRGEIQFVRLAGRATLFKSPPRGLMSFQVAGTRRIKPCTAVQPGAIASPTAGIRTAPTAGPAKPAPAALTIHAAAAGASRTACAAPSAT